MCKKDTGWRGSHVLTRKWIGLENFWDFFSQYLWKSKKQSEDLILGFSKPVSTSQGPGPMGAILNVDTLINQISVEFQHFNGCLDLIEGNEGSSYRLKLEYVSKEVFSRFKI